MYSGLSLVYLSSQKKRFICIQSKQLEVRSGQLIIIYESFISDHGAKMCFPLEMMLVLKAQTKTASENDIS